MELPYDPTDSDSIKAYAEELLNKSLRMVREELPAQYAYGGTGLLGQSLEQYYFFYQPNSTAQPDFPEAGLELKVSPLKRLRNGALVAKERLVLNLIDYLTEHSKTWEESSFWRKNKKILLMYYLHEADKSVYDLVFHLVQILEIAGRDLRIIEDDWHSIIAKIRSGNAHLLSEGDTMYLAACTKGAGHGANLRPQPFSATPAKQRAYSLKKKYMDIVIGRWTHTLAEYELGSIVKTEAEYLANETFEELVTRKFHPFIGKSPTEIEQLLHVSLNRRAKNYHATLTLRMLGVSAKKAEEFEKAEVEIKTIRLKPNNVPKEDVSFPYFHYKELAEEEWESSTLKEMWERRFFFVIYKFDATGQLTLRRIAFWTMPIPDLEEGVRPVWQRTVDQIRRGRADELPRKRESPICHVRPHGRDSKDTDETPSGEWYVKKCFWLNARYIAAQVASDLGE